MEIRESECGNENINSKHKFISGLVNSGPEQELHIVECVSIYNPAIYFHEIMKPISSLTRNHDIGSNDCSVMVIFVDSGCKSRPHCAPYSDTSYG